MIRTNYNPEQILAKREAIKIIAINTKRSKYPFTGIDQNGKSWKLTRYRALSATKQNKREDSK